MLIRHPCYDQHQKKIKQTQLTDKEIPYCGNPNMGLHYIAIEMKISKKEVLKITESLSERELVHPNF